MEKSNALLIDAAARRLLDAARAWLAPTEIAAVIGAVCERWHDRGFAPRRETVARIASAWSYSEALLDESLDALLAPFSRDTVEAFVRDSAYRRGGQHRHELVGFIMPGNVPGAGLHEVVIALVSGASLLIKTASAEPIFFERFARTLREADARVGARIAVFNWNRDRTDLTAALRRNCAWIAAFGDNETIANAGANAMPQPETRSTAVARAYQNYNMIGFGSRMSAVMITREGFAAARGVELADAVARDVSLFEQRGCLSPHHVFVEEAGVPRVSREFAAQLATALEVFALRCQPPRCIGLEDAAAVRRIREIARWRHLGGHKVELWEGIGLGWTVVYDESAPFRASPGYRTVSVSPYVHKEDLERRLEAAAGGLEALGAADPVGRFTPLIARLKADGLSYVCIPGMMQSPPLEWRHGRGAFVDRLRGEK
ncbi:MAG: acyl-CoA reductase [Candidatus Binataceae bacterium]